MSLLQRFIPRSLTNRVYALYGGTLALVFSAGLVLFLSHQYRQQVEYTQQTSVATIEVMAQAVQDSVVIGDYDTLKKTLERSVRGSVFATGTFIDISGGRIVAEASERMSSHPPTWFIGWVASRFQDENRPVTVGGRDYGVLRLRFDSNHVASELWGLTVKAMLGAAVALMAGLVLMRVLITRSLGSLEKLQAFEHAMARGELDASRLDAIDVPAEFERIFTMVRRTAKLVQERERSRRALDNQKFALDQHAIVSITDLSGRITYANDRFCEITGYSRDELMGQNHRLINSGTHPPAFFVDLWNAITAGQVWHGEICNRARDGSLYWVNATVVPLLGDDGLPEQYIAIRTNITDRKQIESSLQAAKEAAEQANHAKSRFLANMSHEIRTPLNAVLGMLRLLRSTPLSPQQSDYVGKSEGAARSLLQLLNDILDFSKIEADKLALESRPLHLDRVLRDLSVILSASVGPKPLEVLFDIEPGLPRTLVGDELRLQQVLINLGGNAIKFTERGEVVISVRLVDETPEGVLLRFEVRDTGIGIPPEKQAQIFDGFSQAEASTTRRYGGTGLGLAICKRLVGMMGGEMALQSEPGQGSTFSFELRFLVHDGLRHAEDTVPMPLQDHEHMRGLRALIVDDNPTARALLAAMSDSLGWQADVAAGGFEAVKLARQAVESGRRYDVVFVDWQMPGMDGWETSLQLRSALKSDSSLVMMVTAHGREMLSHRTPAEQAALGGFLVKPVTASMLFDAVINARLAAQGQAPAAEAAPAQRRLAGLRLLVVEDNANNRQVAQELLMMEGAQVDLAEDGEQGVRAVLAASPPYDAVLMDVQMPVLDGYGATARLRAAGHSLLPIIAMTANAMPSDRQESLAAGMDDHVGKPFDLDALVQTLLRHARRARSVDTAKAAAVAAPQASSTPGLPEAAMAAARDAGVDLAAAVARMGGRVDIYVRMLQSFCSDAHATLASLRESAEAGEWSALAAVAHTLKGSSGMLGAQALYELAASAESAFTRAASQPGADAAHLLDPLEAAARRLILDAPALIAAIGPAATRRRPRRAVAGVEAPGPAATTPADSKALQAALSALIRALQASDMRAVDLAEQLAQCVGAADVSRVAPLQACMETLDFDTAARHCSRWLQEIEA